MKKIVICVITLLLLMPTSAFLAQESGSITMGDIESDDVGVKRIYFQEMEVKPEFEGIPFSLTIAFTEDMLEGLNRYRITAIHNGRNIGGSFSLRHPSHFGITVFHAGIYTFAYVENLRRLALYPEFSYDIVDLAENGPTITMDTLPVIVDDRTLVPVRFIAYALEAEISWNDKAQEVTLILDGKSLTFAIGIAAPELGMDVPAQIIDDRTMVPLRFIGEFFGAAVSWNELSRSIEIVK